MPKEDIADIAERSDGQRCASEQGGKCNTRRKGELGGGKVKVVGSLLFKKGEVPWAVEMADLHTK